MSKILEIWVDGSASYDLPGLPKRGNNARISCAYLIKEDNKTVTQKFENIPFKGTINQAEFIAVLYGMKAARELGATHITIYSDSSLVVNAINRDDGKQSAVVGSKEWTKVIKASKIRDFESCSIEWIPREKNLVDEFLSDELGIQRSVKKKKTKIVKDAAGKDHFTT